jgi:hypothetical protein
MKRLSPSNSNTGHTTKTTQSQLKLGPNLLDLYAIVLGTDVTNVGGLYTVPTVIAGGFAMYINNVAITGDFYLIDIELVAVTQNDVRVRVGTNYGPARFSAARFVEKVQRAGTPIIGVYSDSFLGSFKVHSIREIL